MRANDRIRKVIQINEDNARLQYGYSKSIIDTDKQEKINKVIWSDEIKMKLSKRNIEITNRRNEPELMLKNSIIIDKVVTYVK